MIIDLPDEASIFLALMLSVIPDGEETQLYS
jgi:hypothetical protein